MSWRQIYAEAGFNISVYNNQSVTVSVAPQLVALLQPFMRLLDGKWMQTETAQGWILNIGYLSVLEQITPYWSGILADLEATLNNVINPRVKEYAFQATERQPERAFRHILNLPEVQLLILLYGRQNMFTEERENLLKRRRFTSETKNEIWSISELPYNLLPDDADLKNAKNLAALAKDYILVRDQQVKLERGDVLAFEFTFYNDNLDESTSMFDGMEFRQLRTDSDRYHRLPIFAVIFNFPILYWSKALFNDKVTLISYKEEYEADAAKLVNQKLHDISNFNYDAKALPDGRTLKQIQPRFIEDDEGLFCYRTTAYNNKIYYFVYPYGVEGDTKSIRDYLMGIDFYRTDNYDDVLITVIT